MRLSAFDRFFRSRTQLAAIAVLGLCVLLAVGVQVYSSLNLSRVLSANWRGTYDILVTTENSGLVACLSGSDKLLAPNFVGFSGEGKGITLSQLNAVRSIGGVGIAAPIGAVGILNQFPQDVFAAVPVDNSLGAKGYELRGKLAINDGVGERELSHGSSLVQVSSDPGEPALISGTGNVDSTSAAASVAEMPGIPVTVIAVDPVAEAALLGEHGKFLRPLIAAERLNTSSITASYVGLSKILQGHPQFLSMLALFDEKSAVVPLIVNLNGDRSISVQLSTSTFLPLANVSATNFARKFVEENPPLQSQGNKTIDVSDGAIPFVETSLTFPAPGVGPVTPTPFAFLTTSGGLQPAAASPRDLQPFGTAGDTGCRLRATPKGSLNSTSLGLSGGYREQTYRSLTSLPRPEVPVAPVPVATYSVSDVDLGEGDVSYVPLGAYESGETEILGQVDNPDTAPSQGTLRPGISGLGITTGSAGALTTLEAAKLIRGDTPIDAIRVRVAGVDRYDNAGRAKVAKVAGAIRSLGLHVDIVAGSSREAVSIYVPEYTPTASGDWKDLGWVRQQWSAMDAAAKVESSLDVGGLALLVYAVGGGALLTGTASVLAGIARRRAVRTLRDIGWTGKQALVWVGGEYLIGAGMLFVVSAAALGYAWWADMLSPFLGIVVGVVVAGYCVGGLLSAMLAMRDPQARRRRGVHKDVHPVATAAAFGVKTAARTRGVTITTALTLALIGAGVGMAAGAILGAVTGAGATLLAGVAVSSLLPLHLALALIGVCAGLALAIVGRRADRPRRARALEALTGMGWEHRTMNVSLAAELGVTLIGALILAPAIVAVVSILAHYPLPLTIPLTVAGTILAAGVILTTRTTRA